MVDPSVLLAAAVDYFGDESRCLRLLGSLRWPNGPECPRCFSQERGVVQTRELFRCKKCLKEYDAKTGTIFQRTRLPLSRWFTVVWVEANHPHLISVRVLADAIDVDTKTAFRMLKKIRSHRAAQKMILQLRPSTAA